MTITTNHHWREFAYRYDVPAKVLADEFDWTDEDTLDGFFCYRGWWYHISQFENRAPETIGGFHGIHCDSYFSGVVIKLSDDCERFQVGTLIA